MVATRGEGGPSSSPEWLCTVTHLAVGIVPVALAVRMLSGAAFGVGRAVAAGLGAGAIGALLGELACGRGSAHVLLFHLPAWWLVAGAVVALARLHRRSLDGPCAEGDRCDGAYGWHRDNVIGSTPQEFAALIRKDLALWRKVIKTAGIKAE